MTASWRRRRPGVAVYFILALFAGIVGAGCGGHGQGGSPPDETLTGDVTRETFSVATGRRVAYRGNLTVTCQTATIDGELYAEEATAAGADGSSITVVAQGDVVVSGRIAAGNGVAGGAGGSVELRSETGGITVGSETAARQDTAPTAVLSAGDGADGAEGLTGGPGGEGGSIFLDCRNGTLTIHEQPGLIHVGDGGDGGRGVVGGEDLLTYEAPEQPTNAGGDSGFCTAAANQVSGGNQEGEPATLNETVVRPVKLAAETMSGGAGGAGGSCYLGVDPETEESTWPESVPAAGRDAYSTQTARGADGGHGGTLGGDGGNAYAQGYHSHTLRGSDGFALGGRGGDVDLTPYLLKGVRPVELYWMFPDGRRAGKGGDAKARGGIGWDGEPGEAGGNGGDANAAGGNGGDSYPPDYSEPGRGGEATAEGGRSGNGGGLTCPATRAGGDGGHGGNALAAGGNSGRRVATDESPNRGGSATARGGDGSNGGRGFPGGELGHGGDATASGGLGSSTGKETEEPGPDGYRGPSCEPVTQTRRYKVTGLSSVSNSLGFVDWYEVTGPVTSGRQNQALGGSGNPIQPYTGQNVEFNGDGSRLYVASQPGELRVYANPLDGGDRPPGFWLSPAGNGTATPWYSIELDLSNDRLYALDQQGSVWVWDNASGLTADRPADRQFGFGAGRLPLTIVVAPDRDLLFVAALAQGGGYRVLAADGASMRSGTAAPDREFWFQPDPDLLKNSAEGMSGLAYDSSRDVLYVGRMHNSKPRISVAAGASTANGEVAAAREIVGDATGVTELPLALHYFGWSDLLYAAVKYADLLLFEQASTRDGDTPPTKQDHLVDFQLGAGVLESN